VQRSMSGSMSRTYLLRAGEHVEVALVVRDPMLQALPLAGTIVDTDVYGLLIERESADSVFIPWSNISTVTKLKA
jgi:hypothetical protein